MLDTLYSITWGQTRHRFKTLRLIDIEGRITEGNLIFLVANLSYYPYLNMVKIENGHCQFDMEFVVKHQRVVSQKAFENRVIEEGWISSEFTKN